MKSEIKQRIEQIKNGQVPEGYKKTKLGMVPIEWKEKRIGDVLTQRKTLMCVSEDAPLLSFTIEDGIIEPKDKKSNKRDFLIKDIATKKFALTEIGDIIYNPANLKFGAIHRNNLRRGVVSPIYGIFYSKQNSEFIGYLLHSQRFIDYSKIYTEGTVEKLKTLKADTFLKLKIALPPLAEQEKIAEILSTQDKLIELYQRKIDELQKLKKIYLSKMFPQKGKNIPEWRFPQFTDAWEQRKLGDLVDVCSGRDYKHLSEGDIPVYGTGGYMLSVSEALSYDKDAIGIGRKGTIDKPYILNAPFWTVDTLFYAIPREKVDLNFAFDIFQNIDWKKKDESTGVPSLSKTAINEIDILVPQYDEQQALGQFFNGIDNLITLHQRKLEEMKNLKKALMQLLLTGIVRV